MSFSRAPLKRFNDVKAFGPPVGTYNPVLPKNNASFIFSKSDRFKSDTDINSSRLAYSKKECQCAKRSNSNINITEITDLFSNYYSTITNLINDYEIIKSSTQQQSDIINNNIDIILKEIDNQNEILTSLKKTYAQVCDELTQKNDEHINVLNANISYKAECDKLKKLSDHTNTLYTDQLLLNEKLQMDLNELKMKKDIDSTKLQETIHENKMLKQKNNDFEKCLHQTTHLNNQNAEKIVTLNKANQEQFNIIQTLQNEQKDIESKFNEAIVTNADLIDENTQLKQKIEEYSRLYHELQQQTFYSNQQHNETVHALQSRIKEFENSNQLLSAEVSSCKNSYEAKFTSLTAQYNDLMAKYKERGDIDDLNQKMRLAVKENDMLKQNIKSLQGKINEYEISESAAMSHANHRQKIHHVLDLKEKILQLTEENNKLNLQLKKKQEIVVCQEDKIRRLEGKKRFDPSMAFKHNNTIDQNRSDNKENIYK